MTMQELNEQVNEVLKHMDDSDLVQVWKNYCYENRMYDDEVFNMDYFDEFYANLDPIEVATRVFFGCDEWDEKSSFNPNREWFYLNGYGNPGSLDYVSFNEYANEYNCRIIDGDAVADYVCENQNGLDNDELQELVDEFSEQVNE